MDDRSYFKMVFDFFEALNVGIHVSDSQANQIEGRPYRGADGGGPSFCFLVATKVSRHSRTSATMSSQRPSRSAAPQACKPKIAVTKPLGPPFRSDLRSPVYAFLGREPVVVLRLHVG